MRRGLLGIRVLGCLALCLTACGTHKTSDGKGRLLLWISVDTLRLDHLGAFGSERGLTPNLDRLAQRSVVFERTYAPAPFTVPSVSTFLTGRYPEENAIWSNESILPAQVPTLATILHARGMRTGAVVSNWVLRGGAVGLERGFDEFDDRQRESEATRHLPERIAESTTRDALAMLDRLGGPPADLLLWVHYQDPHGPYTPPPEVFEPYLEAELDAADGRRELEVRKDNRTVGGIPAYQALGDERRVGVYRARYDGEVRRTDAAIGELLRGVRERGYTSPAIVFVADHGENLGEEDHWFGHGDLLNEPLVHVPLLLALPGVAPGRRRDVASLVDLLPTVLHYLAVPAEALPALRGRDLLADDAAESSSLVVLDALRSALAPRRGLIMDGYKYVFTSRPGRPRPWEQLFRLGREDHNLSRDEPALLAHMRAELKRLRAGMSTSAEPEETELNEEDARRMRAIGY